jgi:hypothetical protein
MIGSAHALRAPRCAAPVQEAAAVNANAEAAASAKATKKRKQGLTDMHGLQDVAYTTEEFNSLDLSRQGGQEGADHYPCPYCKHDT